jgi:hypothetical protein
MDVGGVVNATGLKINGVDVGTSSSSYWNAGTGGISYTAGNVGIGTTSPSSKLTVSSPIATASNVVVGEFTKSVFHANGSTILRVSRNIGDIADSASTDIEQNSSGSSPFRYGTYGDSLIVNNFGDDNGPYDNIRFVTDSAVQMTIGGGTIAGKIGIGTMVPLSKLDINGGIAVGSYAGTAAAPTNGAIISGNVGIGTTAPQSKLHVDGGYVQLDNNSGAPASADCDAAAEEGRLYWDATADEFYICSGASGWRKTTTVAP